MPLEADAGYGNGVLRPLQPLDLRESEHVIVSIVKAAAFGQCSLAVEHIARIRREQQDAEPAANPSHFSSRTPDRRRSDHQ
jgi:predicted DNA-binding antitoxin AbrB/MazE fold protein